MEASELRIGNYYRSIAMNDVHRVDLFTFAEWFNDQEADDDSTGDWMAPIPLTEEWLRNFGFLADGDGIFDKDGFTFIVDWQSVSLNSTYDYTGIQLDENEIKYVHQLQNLYFALTGKELELKETP